VSVTKSCNQLVDDDVDWYGESRHDVSSYREPLVDKENARLKAGES
jgi:hypothetical protein